MRWNKSADFSAHSYLIFRISQVNTTLKITTAFISKNNKRHSKILKRYLLTFLLARNASFRGNKIVG
jgi:hypothetical protein